MIKLKFFLKKSVVISLFSFCSTLAFAYVVKKGDTLSNIAQNQLPSPIYGKNGSLRKLIELNPNLSANVDYIIPGQFIILPETQTTLENKSIAVKQIFSSDANTKAKVPACPVLQDKKTDELINQAIHEGTVDELAAILAFTPTYSFMGISATDKRTNGSSTIASKIYPSLETSYQQIWSQDFKSSIFINIAYVSFEEPTNSQKSLAEKEKILTKLGLEIEKKIGPVSFKPIIVYGKELFLRAVSTRIDTVDAINILSAGSKILYPLKNTKLFLLGISGRYLAKFPTNAGGYQINLGHEIGTTIYLHQLKEKETKYLTELGITYKKQDTNLTTQSEKNIFVGVTYFLNIHE